SARLLPRAGSEEAAADRAVDGGESEISVVRFQQGWSLGFEFGVEDARSELRGAQLKTSNPKLQTGARPGSIAPRNYFPATVSFFLRAARARGVWQAAAPSSRGWSSFATSPVQPVWCEAPTPRPVSPWKYSWKSTRSRKWGSRASLGWCASTGRSPFS